MFLYHQTSVFDRMARLLTGLPEAVAGINGSSEYPDIHGTVRFYETRQGVLVAANLIGLPTPEGSCNSPVFGFHIHTGESCSGNAEDPFADAGSHFNPEECPHPYHAGDLPPLFGAHGHAFSVFLTDRFTLSQVIEKTVIIHGSPDDFTTQPAGNAGTKIACGVIRKVAR